MPAEIRLVGPDDANELEALYRGMQQYYNADIVPQEVADQRLFEALTEVGQGFVLMAFAQQAVGFASVIPLFPASNLETTWFLKDLFVLTEARGKHVGDALLRAVANAVVDRGGTRLDLTTDGDNSGAQKFHDRLSAKPVDKIYYRFDDENLLLLTR